MAYTITITNADAYFSEETHMAGPLWTAFNDSEKKAAFAQGRRMLESYLARELQDPDDDADSVTIPRDDYAHYEQCLWLLRNSPFRANAENSGVSWDLIGSDGEAREQNMTLISDASLNWLGIDPSLVLRG